MRLGPKAEASFVLTSLAFPFVSYVGQEPTGVCLQLGERGKSPQVQLAPN